MVHLSPVERVRLLPRPSIAISILGFRTFIGIMSSLLTLVASNVAQILLGRRCWVGTVLAVASSITIPILWATMVVRTSSSVIVTSMVMLKGSSRVWGKTGSLLSSRIILPLSILPLAVVYLLLLPLQS